MHQPKSQQGSTQLIVVVMTIGLALAVVAAIVVPSLTDDHRKSTSTTATQTAIQPMTYKIRHHVQSWRQDGSDHSFDHPVDTITFSCPVGLLYYHDYSSTNPPQSNVSKLLDSLGPQTPISTAYPLVSQVDPIGFAFDKIDKGMAQKFAAVFDDLGLHCK